MPRDDEVKAQNINFKILLRKTLEIPPSQITNKNFGFAQICCSNGSLTEKKEKKKLETKLIIGKRKEKRISHNAHHCKLFE